MHGVTKINCNRAIDHSYLPAITMSDDVASLPTFLQSLVAMVTGNKAKHGDKPYISCTKINLAGGARIESRDVYVMAHGIISGWICSEYCFNDLLVRRSSISLLLTIV